MSSASTLRINGSDLVTDASLLTGLARGGTADVPPTEASDNAGVGGCDKWP